MEPFIDALPPLEGRHQPAGVVPLAVMENSNDEVPRKQLRIGHVSERGGINAVRTLLESQGLVVDEVDGRADYGRDLNVDITTASRVTGGIIGIQVKGGSSFCRKGRWIIPAKPMDWEYWRSSTLPVIGMTWDPDTGVIRWENLSERARSRVLVSKDGYEYELQSDRVSEIAINQILDETTFGAFIDSVSRYLQATSSSAFLELLSDDDEIRCRGVYSCWTLGRLNPAPLILLRRLLPTMDGLSLRDGITALAHATPHPDIFWSSQNWISDPVKKELVDAMRWTPSELVSLVHGVEQLPDDVVAWERGGVGQSLWSIMAEDPDLLRVLRVAARLAAEEEKFDAAVRLLVCYQWVAEDPLEDVLKLLAEVPSLGGQKWAQVLVSEMRDHGRIDVY